MFYETFAFVYDEVMDDSLYQKWLAFTEPHLPQKSVRLLELACGTGILAKEFAKAGHQVTGLDISEEMLAIASEKAFEEQVKIQFVSGDMRDLSEVGTYEVVTCYSDSLCYMPDEQAVQEVFDTVYETVEPGGLFLFDVHSLYQVDKVFPEYSYHDQTEEFAFLWDSYPGQVEHSIEHYLTFFLKEKEDQFVRHDELHQERTYTMENYLRMLENAGFTDVKVCADFTQEAPQAESTRWFFVCKKEEEVEEEQSV